MGEQSAREVIDDALDAFEDSTMPVSLHRSEIADAILAALEAEGYTVTKLVQVGGWCDLHGLCDSMNAEGPGGHTPFEFPENTPVYVATDSGERGKPDAE